ncbi:MAG: hypothetical protein WC821_05000 [archaeon]|jgi:hypothetical protein
MVKITKAGLIALEQIKENNRTAEARKNASFLAAKEISAHLIYRDKLFAEMAKANAKKKARQKTKAQS